VSNGRRRGSSIIAGLLLVLIGVLFLIDIYYPGLRLGHLIAVYWPVLLILWGVAKVIDYMLAQRRGEPRPAAVSGGEAALIVVLVIVLGGFVIRDWVRDRVPHFNFDMPEFGPSYTQSENLPSQTIPPDARLAIDIPRGDIAVEGRAGNELLVSTQKTTWGRSRRAAERTSQGANVRIDNSGGLYRITPQSGAGRGKASFDLSVQAPSSANVAASTNHGDIHVTGTGSAQAHSGDGDINVQNAGGDVNVNLTRGDARISGVAGNLRVSGRGDDVSISDVKGDASVEGPFYGTIRAQNVAQTMRCAVPWSQITVAQLHGTLETDLGDLKLSGAGGPLKIATHNSDVNVKNVAGRIDIADAHGDIKVSLTSAPREDINITDDAGDVDVTLPANSAFDVYAISRSGDVESDFGQVNTSNTNGSGQITGHAGAPGGPRITIATSYGTIHLRKSE
jgi:DUF4097 and DUF4098 domain-containing protein YvlB